MIQLINRKDFNSEQEYQKILKQTLKDIKIHNKLNNVQKGSKLTKEQILKILNGSA